MAEDSRKERLEAVVAAYGTDIRRWPPADRALAPAGSEIIEIAGAREAAALDRLLVSPVAEDADADLMDRILARATQGGAATSAAANDDLTPLGGHAAGSNRTARQSAWSSRTSYRAPAAAAALMAASLALGIFVGSLQSTQSTVARIGTLAGLDMAVAVPSTAFEDDFLAQDEEDIL